MIFFPETSELSESISSISDLGALKLDDLVQDSSQIEQKGRTLVAFDEGKCLAIKLCLKKGDEAKLLKEAHIQDRLHEDRLEIGLCSRLPRPLALGWKRSEHKDYLFKLLDLPADKKAELNLSVDPCAICYVVDESYFTYLNDPLLDAEDVIRGLTLCARDLAKLARKGLIHDSLIPLFHNREQVDLRTDSGVYRWFPMIPGRLDRWRDSCSYPNLRASGIADFEHFSFVYQASAGKMRYHLGDHLLSMSLILGSYCRNKGQFDLETMSTALESFFEAYYTAFTSRRSPLEECIDWDHLACRMKEEMDGDKYMMAIIRCGGPDGKDLMVKSGPHLGHFSGFFPLPEIIKAIHLTTLFAVMEIESS